MLPDAIPEVPPELVPAAAPVVLPEAVPALLPEVPEAPDDAPVPPEPPPLAPEPPPLVELPQAATEPSITMDAKPRTDVNRIFIASLSRSEGADRTGELRRCEGGSLKSHRALTVARGLARVPARRTPAPRHDWLIGCFDAGGGGRHATGVSR
jgi:hypothetical protein